MRGLTSDVILRPIQNSALETQVQGQSYVRIRGQEPKGVAEDNPVLIWLASDVVKIA